MQNVDNLSDIRHAYAVDILMENIERKGGYKSIAQRVLLEKLRTGLGFPPCAPLVDHKPHPLLRIVLVHNGDVCLDRVLDVETLAYRPVIIFVIELCRRTFLSFPTRYGIIVER